MNTFDGPLFELHLSRYCENSVGFTSAQTRQQLIFLMSTPSARQEELITVYLESEPAYLPLVNRCTQTGCQILPVLFSETPKGDDKAVNMPQHRRIIGEHLQLSVTSTPGPCLLLVFFQGMSFTPCYFLLQHIHCRFL